VARGEGFTENERHMRSGQEADAQVAREDYECRQRGVVGGDEAAGELLQERSAPGNGRGWMECRRHKGHRSSPCSSGLPLPAHSGLPLLAVNNE
jgi:hypothetical protein